MHEREKKEALICNLRDAGCDSKVISDFMKYHDKSDVNGQLRLLERQRKGLLERVHAEEKKIDCLDYLVYQITCKRITTI